MARIRTIKPEFFTSFSTAKVSISARLLFVGLLTQADDEGRLMDSPKQLVGAIFPHDDSVTESEVNWWLAEIAETGSIRRYEACGGRYIDFPEWTKHQKISHPSTSRLPNFSGEFPEKLPTVSRKIPKGTGNREQGKKPCDPLGHVDGFLVFWNLYPKRNGKRLGKATSERLWKALSQKDRESCMVATKNYATACAADMTIPKDPERFLRAFWWREWLEPATAPQKQAQGPLVGSVSFDESYYGRSQR